MYSSAFTVSILESSLDLHFNVRMLRNTWRSLEEFGYGRDWIYIYKTDTHLLRNNILISNYIISTFFFYLLSFLTNLWPALVATSQLQLWEFHLLLFYPFYLASLLLSVAPVFPNAVILPLRTSHVLLVCSLFCFTNIKFINIIKLSSPQKIPKSLMVFANTINYRHSAASLLQE